MNLSNPLTITPCGGGGGVLLLAFEEPWDCDAALVASSDGAPGDMFQVELQELLLQSTLNVPILIICMPIANPIILQLSTLNLACGVTRTQLLPWQRDLYKVASIPTSHYLLFL